MASRYQKMTKELEAMTGEQRLFLLSTWWSKLPAALQVCMMAMIRVMLGELDILHNSESPNAQTPARA